MYTFRIKRDFLKHKTVKRNDKLQRFTVVWIRSCKLQHLKRFWRKELRLHWCKSISIIFAPSHGDSLCQNHIKDVCAHCYCTSLVCTLYMTHHVFQACAPSRNSTKYTADDLCSNLIYKYICWMLRDPHFFFGSYNTAAPFLILSIILKNKK